VLLKGNCLETLKTLENASVDSIVTDPPYELGFMGKAWDNSGIAYSAELWAECLRVLKPGGHLLAFSGSRTYHRMAVAIEDSGFEIRDQIMWLYGSGFPKSLNVSKAMDKAAGALEHEGTGFLVAGDYNGRDLKGPPAKGYVPPAPSTPEAQQWQGWGTALKPAHEPIVVARKPVEGTVVNNVLTYGTGALNIDGSRVSANGDNLEGGKKGGTDNEIYSKGLGDSSGRSSELDGRWPANVIHDGSDEVLAGFPITKSGSGNKNVGNRQGIFGNFGAGNGEGIGGDEGSAARFFYCSKASKAERNAGLEGPNAHPTVKPLALMRYLVKLVTPPNGVVLDPFLGSGTTAMAAVMEGFEWVGCEMTEDYWPIIESRVEWAHSETGNTLF
jgi:site-specific DNA-methyltransferase (adenine-specific)